MELLQLKTPTLQGVCDKAVAMEAAFFDSLHYRLDQVRSRLCRWDIYYKERDLVKTCSETSKYQMTVYWCINCYYIMYLE